MNTSRNRSPRFDYDVVVVGSGFGGSVSALRLVEKGYSVAVLEAGRRFGPDDLPAGTADIRSFLWAPALGMLGIQRIVPFKDVLVVAGAGVGGGSLNYANTLYEPLEGFYRDQQWAGITDWRSELAPYYDQAKRMLGVTTNPLETDADRVLQKVAARMGVSGTYHPTEVGVFFGTPGETVADPFFGGAGPARTGCIHCGECMTGCRHGAKNTLLENYLYLAERAGAEIRPETTVVSVRPLRSGGFLIETKKTASPRAKYRRTLRAEQVIFSAGTLGTGKLLHRMRAEGKLPRLSPMLGRRTRTNSEALVGAFRARADWQADPERYHATEGVAITSSIHTDERTHIEPVRYGKGYNAMGLLATYATDGSSHVPRWRQWVQHVGRNPRLLKEILDIRNWSERGMILLVMQDLDNALTTYWRRGLLTSRMSTRQDADSGANPTWIRAAHDAREIAAEEIGGHPGGSHGEVFDVPLTAHFIGGCPIGESPETGVIDAYQRAYGYEGLHVVDGSALSANLGVNPSLTITAQAERAMALWPNKGEVDHRPAVGQGYRRLMPVAPKKPAVPDHAPGALRLPIVEVR